MDEFEQEIDKFLKGMTFENLDYLVRVGPGLLCWAEQRSADAWLAVYDAKRGYKEAEARAWRDMINKPNSKGKTPAQKHVEMTIPLDPRVQIAHQNYSKAEMTRKKIDALTESLRKALSLLPGLQGKGNQLLAHG